MTTNYTTVSTPRRYLPFWRQFRWQLILFIVAAIVLSVTFAVSAVVARTRQQAQQQVAAQLDSVATLKSSQIEHWLDQADGTMDLILNSPDLRAKLIVLLTASDADQDARVEEATAELVSFTGGELGLQKLMVYDRRGTIVASSDPHDVPGISVAQGPYFQPSLQGQAYIQPAYFDQVTRLLTVVMTQPIRNYEGQIIGVLAGQPEMGALREIMLERTGLGTGGETYLVSASMSGLLTPVHDEKFVLEDTINSTALETALLQVDGSGVYYNYQEPPVQVIGVYRWNADLGAALLAEIPVSEALAGYDSAQIVSYSLAALAALFMAGVGFLMINRLARPISDLTYTATRISRGDLGERASIRANNEFGVLATAFNSMADQLESMVTSLELRVQERTRDLQVASEVARQVTAALNLDELLPRVVELTKDSFKLYHAHIYLIDDAQVTLRMEAGAGDAGRLMKEMGHSIPLGAERSLVARAARSARPVIANDVQQEDDFLPNPLLPDTRSEMAVPLLLGDKAIGVLDVQSSQPDRFSAQDADVMSALAGQVAIAVQNARLFEQTGRSERLLRAVLDATPDWIWAKDSEFNFILVNRALASQSLGVAPEEAVGKSDYDFHDRAYVDGDSSRGIRGLREDDRAALQGQEVFNPRDALPFKDGSEHVLTTRKAPLYDAEGKVIGTLGVGHDITELENVRRRQQTAYELGERLNTVLDMEQLLGETITRLGETFRYYHAHIYLFDGETEHLTVAEGLGEAGTMLKSMGHFIPLGAERSLVARAARTLEVVVVENVLDNPDHLPNPLLPETRSEVAIPLYTGDRLLGVLDVQSDIVGHFDEDEIRTLRIIAGQLSVALTNARLFEEAQSALQETATLYASSEQISRAASFDDLLHALVGTTPLSKFDRAAIALFSTPWMDRRPDSMITNAAWEASGEPPRLPVGTALPLDKMPVLATISLDEPTVFNDVLTDPRIDTFTRSLLRDRLGMNAIVIFPLVVAGQWLGMVNGQAVESIDLDEAELRHIATVVDQAATVVQNLLLLADAQTRLNETAALQARLQAIIDAANSAIISFGADEGLLVFNDVAEETFGYSGDEARALGVDTFIVDFSQILKRAAGTERQLRESFEVMGRRKNGEEFPAEISLSWITLEDRPVITIVLADITERRRRESRERLAYEVGQDLTILFSPELLLRETINHLHQALGYYHAHVYLLNDPGDTLFVAEGLGEAGRILKEMGHSIPYRAERSLVARAARTLEPVVVNNVYDSPDHLPNPLLADTVSEVALPLYSGDRLLGVLDVQHSVPDFFTEPEVRTLRIVANQLTIALANAQLYQEQLQARADIERSNRNLALLNRIIDAASSTLNKVDMLKLVCYELATAFRVPQAAATLLTEDKRDFEVVAEYLSAGRPSALGDLIPISGNPISEMFIRERRPIVVDDVRTDHRMAVIRDIMERRGTVALMLLPFVVGDEVIGSVGIDAIEARQFSEEDITLATNVAAATSQALHNALLFEETLRNAERLREVDRLKSEFLANMSHELRTPLNSIIGYSELLIDEMGGTIDEMSFEDLKAIHSSGQHLLAIINDVLDLAKIEAGRLELNRTLTNFSELAAQVQESARVLVKEKSEVALELDLQQNLPEVEADKVRLRQIIWNLLSNAIKFTEEGCVALGASVKDGTLYVQVRDTGIGIAPDYQQVIFDQFRQADGSATRKAGGTGLGLAITRQLVWLHGGDIWCESELGKGSVFTFTLPVKAPADAKPSRPLAQIPEAQPGAD